MNRLMSAAAALALLGGCYFGKKNEDRPWSVDAVKKIEVGKTTKAQVLQILGPPKEVVRLLESEAYMYIHSIEKSSGTYLVVLNLSRTDRQMGDVTPK